MGLFSKALFPIVSTSLSCVNVSLVIPLLTKAFCPISFTIIPLICRGIVSSPIVAELPLYPVITPLSCIIISSNISEYTCISSLFIGFSTPDIIVSSAFSVSDTS